MIRTIIFFIAISSTLFGQRDSVPGGLSIIYGQKYLSHKTFDGKINDIEDIKIGAPISYIGFGNIGDIPITRVKWKNHGHGYYTQVIPQTIQINDSISAKISGFNVALTLLGYDVFPNQKKLDLMFSLGFNTGRLRFYGNPYVNQKNPYFCPKISVTPRIIVHRICFQVIIDCQVDISRKNWRKTNFSSSPKINLPQTSNTGIMIMPSIGYIFSTKVKQKPVVEEYDE